MSNKTVKRGQYWHLTKKEANKFRRMYEKQGLRKCFEEAGDNLEAKMVCDGLNYDYFIGEAESIVRELKERKYPDEYYIEEKMRHLVQLFKYAHRLDPPEDKQKKLWDDISNVFVKNYK